MKFVAIFLIFTCFSLKAAEIELRSVYTLLDDHSRNAESGDVAPDSRYVDVWVYIKNTGDKDVRVPTKSMDQGAKGSRDNVTFQLRAGFTLDNPLALKAITPETDFAPVVLRKGEQAVIEIGAWMPLKRLGDVRITYEVESELADRYGFWSGKVVIESQRLDGTTVPLSGSRSAGAGR